MAPDLKRQLASSANSAPLREKLLVAVVVLGNIAGCGEAPTPPIDPAKSPWLNPASQIDGLKNSDFRIRGLSAFNLGNLGAKTGDAIPELERLAKEDPNQKVRENAAEALAKIRAAAGNSNE
jgi:HEAT repeat protein